MTPREPIPGLTTARRRMREVLARLPDVSDDDGAVDDVVGEIRQFAPGRMHANRRSLDR
jgi:hypothetical protein